MPPISHRALATLPSRLLQPHISKRTLTTTCSQCRSQITAAEAAERLTEAFARSNTTRRQLIDGNQVQRLALTLGRRTLANGGGGGGGVDILDAAPAAGTPIPPGYHLVYFTPGGLEVELGADGSDRTFNAPEPFTRRMWAGGRMEWPSSSSSSSIGGMLRVGDEIEESTRLLSATPKKSKSVGEMVLVEVEKTLRGPQGVAVVDTRSWIFRPEMGQKAGGEDILTTKRAPRKVSRQPTWMKDIKVEGNDHLVRRMSWSPVGLFRFSALTFNGHKIHYNDDWAEAVEGHPGLVVHGPLNLINILDYWRDVHGGGERKGLVPREVRYRAVAPVYAGQEYELRTGEVKGQDEEVGRRCEVVAVRDGEVCMKAEVFG